VDVAVHPLVGVGSTIISLSITLIHFISEKRYALQCLIVIYLVW